MKHLINKTIFRVFIDTSFTYILFIDSREQCFLYKTIGECCSESYIYEITGIKNLYNKKIISVESKYIDNKIPEKSTEEAIKKLIQDSNNTYSDPYAYTLKTTAGYCDIIFRNFSNGSYTGEIEYYSSIPSPLSSYGWQEWQEKIYPFLESCRNLVWVSNKNSDIKSEHSLAILITDDWHV